MSITHITPYQLELKSCFSYTWLFCWIFQLASTVAIKVNVQHMTVMVGQTLMLNCSVNHPNPMTWWHEYLGTGDPNPVHYDGIGMVGFYQSGGRHSIHVGTNDLMIKNVTDSNAGIYTCKDAVLEEPVDVYDIVILKSVPSCTSNIDLANVIGENDCGIDQDLLRLHCSVDYHGNFAPRLHWQNSGGEHAWIGTNVSTPIQEGTNNSTESILTVTANMPLNDTYFTCKVAVSQSVGVAPECRTEKITVHSLHNSSDTLETYQKSEKEISCTATSSQPCNYQWTHQYEKYKIVIHGSTLNFRDVSFGDGIYECQAECRLRGQICHTMPLRISVVAGGMNNSDETVGVSGLQMACIIVSLGGFIVAVAVVSLCIRRRYYVNRRAAHEAICVSHLKQILLD